MSKVGELPWIPSGKLTDMHDSDRIRRLEILVAHLLECVEALEDMEPDDQHSTV